MSADLGSAAGLALAAIFGWAGMSKLVRPAATRRSFDSLGVPAPPVLAWAVPAVEVGLAAALIAASRIAAWCALAILAGFALFLISRIRSGSEAPCACFGTARSEPVASTDVARNVMLAALAVVATGAPGGVRWPSLGAVVAVSLAVAAGRGLLAVLDLLRSSRSRRLSDVSNSR